MKVYELMVILRGDLDEETYKKAASQVEKTIKAKHGTVTSLDEWGKRKLAYPIDKQDFGYYAVLRFTSEEPSAPRDIQQALTLDEQVLRSMTIIAKSTKRVAESDPKPAAKKKSAAIEEAIEA